MEGGVALATLIQGWVAPAPGGPTTLSRKHKAGRPGRRLLLLPAGLFLLLAALAFLGQAQAATSVPAGTLSTTTWNFAGSPYTLEGKITVPDGATLRIEPGVVVQAPGGASIEVYGSLVIVGAPSSRVELRLAPPATLWAGVKVLGAGSARIENATIEHTGTGLFVRTSGQVTLSDVDILDSNSDGVSISGDTGGVSLTNVRIQKAGTAVRAENGNVKFVGDRLNISGAFDCISVRAATNVSLRYSTVSSCQHDGVYVQLSNNVSIESTAFTNWSQAAVAAQSSSRVTVGYSTFNASEPAFAVFLSGTRDSIVRWNTITMKEWPSDHLFLQESVGIELLNPSGRNQVRGNNITLFAKGIVVSGAGTSQWLDFNTVGPGSSTGVSLVNSANQTLTGNAINGRGVALWVTSTSLTAFLHYRQTMAGNTANGRGIEWLMDLSRTTVNAAPLAILAIVDSNNVTVENATFDSGNPSLLIERSQDIVVRNSTATSTGESTGIGVLQSQRVLLENLVVSGGLRCMSFARGSDNHARGIQASGCFEAVLSEGTEANLLIERLNVTGSGRVDFYEGTNLTLADSTITGTFGTGLMNAKRIHLQPPAPQEPPPDPPQPPEPAEVFGRPQGVHILRVRMSGVDQGVVARDFDGLTIQELTVTQADVGVFADTVTNMIIENSTLNGRSYGLKARESTGLHIANSTFAGALMAGALCAPCYGFLFLGNTFTANTVGLNLPNGTGGLVTRNLFFFQQANANTATVLHQWDDGAVGNLWDDYLGLDADMNGIGDTPYPVPGGADQDRYPIARYADDVPPVANAGPDIDTFEDVPVLLTGYLSTDDVGIRTYLWSLVDGGANVTVPGYFTLYWFATPGTYTVTLTVIDYGGNRATDTLVVAVRDRTAPVANAGGSRTVDEDVVVTLDASGSTDNDPQFPAGALFTWYISDGTTTQAAHGRITTWTFVTPGLYDVRLVVADAVALTDQDAVKITVQDKTPPVVPALQVPLATEDAPFRVYGSAPTDNDPDWPKGELTWFELRRDGIQIGWTNASPGVFNVSEPGPLEAVFFVRDAAGNVAWASVNFTAADITPPSLALFGDRQCEAGTPVAFDISMASDNDPGFPAGAVVNWTFFVPSGRINLEGPTVSLEFPLLGDFQAVLRVKDAAKNQAEQSFTVRCADTRPPTVSVEGPMSVEVGELATFRANASDVSQLSETTWQVTGLAGVRQGTVLAYRFFVTGSYQVSAFVEDFYGHQGNASLLVVVVDTRPPSMLLELIPVAHNGTVEVTVFQAFQVAYRGTDNSGPVEVGWTWGDGTTSTGPAAAHNWSEPGNYTVMVRVADALGNSNTTTFVVRVAGAGGLPVPPPPDGGGANPQPTQGGLSGLAVAIMVVAGVAGGAAIGFRLGRGKHKPEHWSAVEEKAPPKGR